MSYKLKERILLNSQISEKKNLDIIQVELLKISNQKPLPCVVCINNNFYKYYYKRYQINNKGQIKLPKVLFGYQLLSKGLYKRVYEINFTDLPTFNPFIENIYNDNSNHN